MIIDEATDISILDFYILELLRLSQMLTSFDWELKFHSCPSSQKIIHLLCYDYWIYAFVESTSYPFSEQLEGYSFYTIFCILCFILVLF